jgi:uncharacterized protein YqhQ
MDAKPKKIDFAIGGQALIEGIMMRSPNFITIAVRKKNGSIKTKEDPFKSVTKKYKILGIPIVRGLVNMVEMMSVGMKALNFSTNEFFLDDETLSKEEEAKSKKQTIGKKILNILFLTFNFIIALAFALFLFKFLPLLLTDLLSKYFPYLKTNYLLYNLIDGLIKASFFIIYIFVISLFSYFRKVFEYHGAEHKSIFTYEKELPLTVENAKKQSRFHPRCGTSFLFIVIVISIIVYTFLPPNPVFAIKLGERIALLPVIAGISYELLKISAKHQNNFFVKAFTAPGLLFQRITTKEPNDKQLEIGLAALQKALDLEKNT